MSGRMTFTGLLAATAVALGLVACGAPKTPDAAPTPSAVAPVVRPVSGASSLSVPTTLLPPTIRLPLGVDVAKEATGLLLTLVEPALTFARDAAEVADPSAAAALAATVAEVTRARPGTARVEVRGFASADGPTVEYDQALSAARAATVCRLLRTAGVAVADGDCRGEGRAGLGADSRRVEVRLVGA